MPPSRPTWLNSFAGHLLQLYPAAQVRKALAATAPAERVPFGPAWVKKYLPHYAGFAPADFHLDLFPRLRDLHARRDSKEAIIAPRDGAKSTTVTLAYVLRCAVESLERFVLILSDSAGQAAEKLGDIRRELEVNPALAADYPAACGVGPCWRQDRIELRNGVVVQAIGTGGRIRGRRNRQARPTLVVFDDVENNTTITSESKRKAAWRWATREVIPAGTAGTNFLSVGSALHPECVAVRLGELAGWAGHTYPAVHEWPDRMDLWLEWERLATNLIDRDRETTAAAFYSRHRADMEAGARVYWPERWPLLALMKRRAEVGEAAFETEWQGVPTLGGVTVWPPELFDADPARGTEFWFDQWPADLLLKVVSLDPSAGGLDGDYQAHAAVGVANDRYGTLYIDCELRHEHTEAMIRRTLTLARDWGRVGRPVDAVLFEDNGTMGLMEGAIQSNSTYRDGRPVSGAAMLPWKTITQGPGDAKGMRIVSRTGPYLDRRVVRVRNTPGGRLLVKQWKAFPHGDHDDGPDAVATAIKYLELIALGRQ